MSLTVAQLMKLPCLRRAKVLVGHKSLDRLVTSISVLEYASPTETQRTLCPDRNLTAKRSGNQNNSDKFPIL